MGFRKFRPVRYPMCGMSVSSQPGDKKKGRGPGWLGSKGEMLYIHSGAVNQRDPAVRGQQPVSLKEGTQDIDFSRIWIEINSFFKIPICSNLIS